MTEILEDWFLRNLGCVVDLQPQYLGPACQDGMIIGQLLHNYNVISAEQLKLLKATSPVSNLNKLSHWLQPIGIECTEETINDITNAGGLAATKLLYQLYLNLEDKDRLLFVTERCQQHRPLNEKFSVTVVGDGKSEGSRKDNPLSYPLAANRELIRWHKNKYKETNDQLQNVRERYKQKFKETARLKFNVSTMNRIKKTKQDEYMNLQKQINKFEDQNYTIEDDLTYEELIEKMNEINEKQLFYSFDIKKYMTELKERKKKLQDHNDAKIKLQNLIFNDLWQSMIQKQEKELNYSISTKMLKQSEYEKQITAKLFEIRHQRDIVLHNRKIFDNMIKEKREQELDKALFEQQRQSDELKLKFLLEKRRAAELHHRLYLEKLKEKAEKNYKTCSNIVSDITDIAIKIGHYHKCFDEDVPLSLINEWKALFYDEQPLFDVLKNVEEIIEEENIDEDVLSEKERQIVLNNHDYNEFINYIGVWDLRKLLSSDDEHNMRDVNEQDIDEQGIGQQDVGEQCIDERDIVIRSLKLSANLIGHIIHKLLLIKYPYPVPPEPPKLPPFSVAACIKGINDFTILPTLQIFLNKRNISVIEMQNAINYCLEAFKTEMIGIEDIDLQLAYQTVNALKEHDKKTNAKEVKETKRSLAKNEEENEKRMEEENKDKKKDSKKDGKKDDTKDSSKGKNKSSSQEPVYEKPECIEKLTQTPVCLPESKALSEMSNKAVLGHYAYQSMNLGQPVTNELLVAILIEFLKTLEDKDGFVLCNFPNKFEEAIILEETVTARTVPLDEFDLDREDSIGKFEQRDLSETEPKDCDSEKRLSRIFTNPHPKPPPDPFTTFLTAFIFVKHHPIKIIPEKDNLDERKEDEDTDLLSMFYTDQGINYCLYYNSFDLQTIKQLAKLVIGDYSLPRKTSTELFGSLEELALASPKTGKKPQAKKVENNVTQNKNSENTTNTNVDSKENIVIEVTEEEKNDTEEEIIPEILPGEEGYEYVDLPQPEAVLRTLANLWENSENVMVGDLMEIFFIKRTLNSIIMPYMTSVKQHMKHFIDRPDIKQNFIYDFQKMYNAVDPDLRDDVEVKAELHCHLRELRDRLGTICDQRMSDAEQERQRIINERWISDQMCLLSNLYISTLQLTMDLYVDFLQISNDYYNLMLGKQLDPDKTLKKITLDRIRLDAYEPTSGATKDKRRSESRQIGAIIAAILKDAHIDKLPEQTPYYGYIENAHFIVKQMIETIVADCLKYVQSEESVMSDPKKAAKAATSGKNAKKGVKKLPPPSNLAQIVEQAPRLFNEWRFVLNAVTLRLNVRLDAVKIRAEKDLYILEKCAIDTFHGIYNQISQRYQDETNSVTVFCSAISKAIEEGIRIQPALVLDDGQFFVDKNILLFPDIIPEPEGPVQERITPSEFTIEQLTFFYKILNDIAPNGSISERNFSYILQDLIVHDAEDGFGGILPAVWSNIDAEYVTEFIRRIYGEIDYLDWRDFIIYNLDIEFPSEEVILEMLLQLSHEDSERNEIISKETYDDIKLWFEYLETDDPQMQLRIKLIKELLFKMYSSKEGFTNYTGLLLAFCKDIDPIKGLAKALSLVLRSLVCWDFDQGNKFVEAELDKRRRAEILRANAESTTKTVLSDILDETLLQTEGIVITELFSSSSSSAGISVNEENIQHVDNYSFTDESIGEEEGEDRLAPLFSGVEIVNCLKTLSISDTEERIYFVTFESVLNVLSAALPWHIRNQIVENKTLKEEIENIFTELVTDLSSDGTILSHLFFKHNFIIDYLSKVFKFKIVRPADIVNEVINIKNQSTITL